MNKYFWIAFMLPCILSAQVEKNWDVEKIEVVNSESSHIIMDAKTLYKDKWSELPQPIFWKQIMKLPPDSCLVNVASSRTILAKMSVKDWNHQSEARKDFVKDSLKQFYGIDLSERVNVTTGKNDFYRFNDVYPTLSRGVQVFEETGVDPWYAQAILLIESPGQLKKSCVGAYGAFQLMPSVARAMGLVVNNHVDERKDFDKSAMASAKLIKRVCIPEAKKILSAYNFTYDESDIWFRLFVLHVYHAGAMNVKAVVSKINPNAGNQELIKQMWQTTAASFGNNSQNYTQLALASQIILNEMVFQSGANVFDCTSITYPSSDFEKKN